MEQRPLIAMIYELLDTITAEGKKGGWPNIVTWREIQTRADKVREKLDGEAGDDHPSLP